MKTYLKSLNLKVKALIAIAATAFVVATILVAMAGGGF